MCLQYSPLPFIMKVLLKWEILLHMDGFICRRYSLDGRKSKCHFFFNCGCDIRRNDGEDFSS